MRADLSRSIDRGARFRTVALRSAWVAVAALAGGCAAFRSEPQAASEPPRTAASATRILVPAALAGLDPSTVEALAASDRICCREVRTGSRIAKLRCVPRRELQLEAMAAAAIVESSVVPASNRGP